MVTKAFPDEMQVREAGLMTIAEYKHFGEVCKKIRKHYPYISQVQVEREALKVIENEKRK